MVAHDGRLRVSRWAWAEIDHDAIRHNVEVLRRAVSPSAVWAVVKADGYGHGAIDVARSALAAGAEGLCVALADEGVELRGAGIDAPILLLSEQPLAEIASARRASPDPDGLHPAYVEALAALDAGRARRARRAPQGRHRHAPGRCRTRGRPRARRRASRHAPRLRLAGVATHLASADDTTDPATAEQLATFEAVLAALPANPVTAMIHAANSAGALAHPAARYSFVRAGIAMYGISPGHGVDHLCGELRPAMSLRSRVSYLKRVAAGSPDLLRAAPHVHAVDDRRHGPDRVCRRGAAPPLRDRWRGARRWPPPSDRRCGHDGSADGRLSATTRSRSATKWCCSASKEGSGSVPRSGLTGSARSGTRSCAV